MAGPDFKSGREAARAVSGVFDSHTSPPEVNALNFYKLKAFGNLCQVIPERVSSGAAAQSEIHCERRAAM